MSEEKVYEDLLVDTTDVVHATDCTCEVCAGPSQGEDSGAIDSPYLGAGTSVGSSGSGYTDGVLAGVAWDTTNLTFSFPTDTSHYGYNFFGEISTNFNPATDQLAEAVRDALSYYSSYSNLQFTEVTESATTEADLRFARSDAPGTAWAYEPDAGEWGGDAWFHNGTYDNPQVGSYAYAIVLHEVGHTLGLHHGHESGVFGAVPDDQDSLEYTVMTYSSYVGDSSSAWLASNGDYPQTPMMLDIAAIQHMYGADYNHESGDTVYSWDASNGDFFINGANQGGSITDTVFRTVWDGGGNDTYDFSNYTTDLQVDLNPGAWTTVSSDQLAHLGGGNYARGNIANALLHDDNPASLIENAVGGVGDDTIVGNQADNVLNGGAGNDTLNGGDGNDTLIGGAGNDTLNGGAGSDAFIVDASSGADLIEGFSAGSGSGDVLDLSATTLNSFSAVLSQSSDTIDGVVIQIGGGASVTLEGVSRANLNQDDFIYGTSGNPVDTSAQTPSLSVSPAAGTEDSAIALNVASSLTDTDGSESLALQISGVPAGASLSAGTDLGGGVWSLSSADLLGLTVTPATNSDAEFALTVTATSTETNGDDTASISETINVTVDGVADTPDLTVADSSGDADSAIVLSISSSLTDLDGSESLALQISGVPAGASLSAGTDLGGGVWSLSSADLTDLTVTPAAGDDTDFTLTVTATSTEANGGDTASISKTIDVTVADLQGTPGGDVADFSGEPSAISAYLAGDIAFTSLGEQDLTGIDHVIGSSYNDWLFGDELSNTLEGGDGIDRLYGQGGNDTLLGGKGNDQLYGGQHDDHLDGGDGFDFTFYGDATGGVSVNLMTGTATGAYGSDTLTDIEGISGSNFGDSLVGDAEVNYLFGLDGDDVLDGAGGNDQLVGGKGDDVFVIGGDGGSVIIHDLTAGAGSDDAVDLSVFGFSSFSDVMAQAVDTNSGVTVQLDGTNSLTLSGVNKVDLHQDDFSI